MITHNEHKPDKGLIISYLLLRQFIGWIGVLLPVFLVIGSGVFTFGYQWFQHSISHYYYSIMHIVFVGTLCLLGGFLITYKGKSKYENICSNFAGIFSLGVAAFPTCCEGFQGTQNIYYHFWYGWFQIIHFSSAGLLFVCFAVFCFYLFQKADDGTEYANYDKKKKRRNKMYKACGWIIIVSIACIGITSIFSKQLHWQYYTILFETTSLWAFGLSWIVKGSTIFKHVRIPIFKALVRSVR